MRVQICEIKHLGLGSWLHGMVKKKIGTEDGSWLQKQVIWEKSKANKPYLILLISMRYSYQKHLVIINSTDSQTSKYRRDYAPLPNENVEKFLWFYHFSLWQWTFLEAYCRGSSTLRIYFSWGSFWINYVCHLDDPKNFIFNDYNSVVARETSSAQLYIKRQIAGVHLVFLLRECYR